MNNYGLIFRRYSVIILIVLDYIIPTALLLSLELSRSCFVDHRKSMSIMYLLTVMLSCYITRDPFCTAKRLFSANVATK